jgi:hypothetical protein
VIGTRLLCAGATLSAYSTSATGLSHVWSYTATLSPGDDDSYYTVGAGAVSVGVTGLVFFAPPAPNNVRGSSAAVPLGGDFLHHGCCCLLPMPQLCVRMGQVGMAHVVGMGYAQVLVCLNGVTGAEVWVDTTLGGVVTVPAIGPANILYVGTAKQLKNTGAYVALTNAV